MHVADRRYSHTLDLTPLLPYIKAANGEAKPGKHKPGYLAADIPATLVGDPIAPAAEAQKTTLLTFLVKAMLLAMEEHPIMRAKIVGDGAKERALEIRRDGVVGVAVSGESSFAKFKVHPFERHRVLPSAQSMGEAD